MNLVRLLLPFLLVGAGISGAAAADADALDPAKELFFSRFRTAVHGEDTRQLMQLTHPQAKACTRYDERERYYGVLMKGLVLLLGRLQIIEEIKGKPVDARSLKEGSSPPAGMHWPITPEEQLVIRYMKDGKEETATIYIARDKDQWKWVHLCVQ